MKKSFALVIVLILLVGCGKGGDTSGQKADTSIVFEELNFAGTYIGLHGSGITLFSDGSAEYFWKDWSNVEVGDSWEYVDNKIVFHSTNLGYDIYADISGNNSSTLNFMGVGDTDWQDEMFVKISDDTSNKSVDEYVGLIEKQLNVKLDRVDADETKIAEYSGFTLEYPGSFVKGEENQGAVVYSDEENGMGLVIVTKLLNESGASEDTKETVRGAFDEYLEFSLEKVLASFEKEIDLQSDGVSIVNISNDSLKTKTAKVDGDEYNKYYTVYYDEETLLGFVTVFLIENTNDNLQVYKDIVKSVKYIGNGYDSTTDELHVDLQKEASNDDGVDPELKEFLDSYEAFMDEYVEFMKKYNANPSDIGLLADYTEIMQKYMDFSETVEKYDADEMSKDDAKYYMEVMNRVNKKLLEITE